jgi:putative ATP-dependent endonuclease of the OLD family
MTVVKWAQAFSLEERVFTDLPWAGVVASFELACACRGERDPVLDQVGTQYGSGFSRDTTAWTESPALRTAMGKAAKVGDWYKRQDWAQAWAGIIARSLEHTGVVQSDLGLKLTDLRRWIDCA